MTSVAPARQRISPLALPALLIAVFLVPLSIAGIATVLPDIARDLGSDTVPLQWVVNGFNASFAAFTLVWGVVSDHIGYKRTFVIGVIGSIASLVFCAVAPDLLALDVARILAGASGAAVLTCTPAIIAGAFHGATRARGFALFGTTIGLGLAVGPTIAGALSTLFGWRGVFVAIAALITVSLAMIATVPNFRHRREPGAKVIDLNLLRNTRFISIILMPVLQTFGFVTLLTYLPSALSSVYGLSSGQLALVMIALSGPVLIGPIIGVHLERRFHFLSVYGIFYGATALMLLGNAGMLLLAAFPPVWVLFLPMLLLGLSFGLPLGLIDRAALESVPAVSSGSASGLLQFARLGSEAVIVGGYALLISTLVAAQISDPMLAQQVSAGFAGYADDYLPAFVTGQIIIMSAVAASAAVVALLHRAALRAEAR